MMPASDQRPNLVALVTGASRGIGSVIVRQLAARGVRIALHHRSNRDAAEATLDRLPERGTRSLLPILVTRPRPRGFGTM